MSRGILFVSALVGILSIISIVAGAELSYDNAQNMSIGNTTGNMTNATSDGNRTDGNATASNTQTSLALKEGVDIGSISNAAKKCLGSALCPD